MNKYLIQYNVDSHNVYCNEPVEFKIKDISFILYLHDKDIFTTGYKLHVICEANTEIDALKKIGESVTNFQERLIYYTGKKIFINRYEFIMPSQKGQNERKLYVRIIKQDEISEVDKYYFNFFQELLNLDLQENEILALHHIALAIIEQINTSKFRSLFLGVEDLVDRHNIEVKCGKCERSLQCPEGHGPKKYDVTKKSDINKFFTSEYIPFPDLISLDVDELWNFRMKLFHSMRKKGGFLNEELNDIIHNLSMGLNQHFQSKYNLEFPGGLAITYPPISEARIIYKSKNKDEEFDLKIPTLKDIYEYNNTDEWRIDYDT